MAKISDVKKKPAATLPREGVEALMEAEAEASPAKAAPVKKAAAKKAADPLEAATALTDLREYVKACYVGPGGSGKTTDVCTMANMSTAPTYVVNAEGGLKESALRRMGIATDRIRVLPQPGQKLTFGLLEDTWLAAKARLDDDPESINGFVWDSVTEIHTKLLRNIVEEAVERQEAKGKDRDPFFTALEDYGVMAAQVVELLRRYRDLPCHFGMTALERRDKDGDGKVVIHPGVTPALITPVLGWPDIVCYTSVEDFQGVEEYRGLTRPIGKFRGKDRFKVLPRYLLDPTFERIAAYVYGEMDIDTDAVMIEARERHGKRVIQEAEVDDEQDTDASE